jgi:hypothetical protein
MAIIASPSQLRPIWQTLSEGYLATGPTAGGGGAMRGTA